MTALNLDTYSLSLITAKEDILSDRSSADWAVFTYEKKWSLKLLDSGVGGLEELTRKLSKNLIQYGLCRVHDPNSGVQRVILIHWVGENVDASRKEVTIQHLPSIRRFFKEANVLLGAQKVEDVTQERVAQALSRVPPPARVFQKPRIPGSRDVVGTNYMKTNPAAEMKISRREAFWQRSEREEERRKETERMRLQEERLNLERDRIQRERLEEEERERRIQEKEQLVEGQRKEQARMEAERRRLEKERWAQQQKDYEEELKGRFRRSQSIEMAAEAAALVSSRSLHPREVFRQHERSVSTSFSPPSTPSSPSKASSGFFHRTTLRYQRSVTESILTPTSRSPTFFQGFQKRDSFRSPSPSIPQPCSPAFIFSKSPLPGTSPKVDSLPSFIPPPMTASRATPTQVLGGPQPPHTSHTSSRLGSSDASFRAEYVTINPAEFNPVTSMQERPHHEDHPSLESPARLDSLYRAELVPVDSPSTSHPEVQEFPNITAKSPTSFTPEKLTAIKATVSVSSPVTEIAFTYPSPIPEARIPASPRSIQTAVPIPPSVLQGTLPANLSAAEVMTPAPAAQLSSSALTTHDRSLAATFRTNEASLSTNSSYEPKMSTGTSALVSLLAPIPYTPYSSTRASVLPVSAHPLIDSIQGYQQSVTHVSEPLSVYNSNLSERPPKPQPDPTLTEVTLVDPVAILASLPVYKSTTPQPRYDQIDLPDSLTQSKVPPVKGSSESQPSPNSPLPWSSSTSSSLPSRNSPPSEPSHDIPLPWSSSTSSSLPSRNSPHSEPSPYSPLPWSSSTSSSLPSRNSPHSEPSPNSPLPWSSSTSSSLTSRSLPSSESSNNQTKVLFPDESQPNNLISDKLFPESLPVSLPNAFQSSSELQSSNIQLDSPTTGSPPEFLPCGAESSSKSLLYLSRDSPLLEYLPECPPCDIGNSAESVSNDIQPDIRIPESSSSTIPITVSAEFQSKPLLLSTGPDVSNIKNDTPFVEPLSSSLINERSTQPQSNNIQADNPLIQSPSITTLGSSGSQLRNIQVNIPLTAPVSGSSSLHPEISSDLPVFNIQPDSFLEPQSSACEGYSGTDIPISDPPPRSSALFTENLTEPQLTNTQPEPLPEPSTSTIEDSTRPQLNVESDIPLIEPFSESSSLPSDGCQVEPSCKLPSIPTAIYSGSQLNNQAFMPLIEPLLVSSSTPPGDLPKLLSNNIQLESSAESKSLTSKASSAPQVTKGQADIPSVEPLPVPSVLPIERSSGLQSNIEADSLTDPCCTIADSTGLQLNNVQEEPLTEPSSFTSEDSVGGLLIIAQADPLLVEASLISLSFPSEGSEEPKIHSNPVSSSTCSTHERLGDLHVSTIQAEIQLLESSPVLLLSSEPEHSEAIAVAPESSLLSLQTTSSSEPHPNYSLAENPLMGSSPLPTEDYSKSQPNNGQTDIQQADVLPRSSPLSTEDYFKFQPKRGQTDLWQAEVLPRSSPLHMEDYSESQPNKGQTDTQRPEVLPKSAPLPTENYSESQLNREQSNLRQAEVLPRSSPPPTEDYSESQPNRGQSNLWQADILPRSSPLPTENYSESQINRGQPDIQQAEVLPRSSPLHTEHYSESQPNRGQIDIQQAEVLPRSSPLPTEDYSESQLNRGQPDLQREEILPRSSPLPTEDYSESQPNRGQPDLQQAEILPRSSPLPTEDYSESQLNRGQPDLQREEILPRSSPLPTEDYSESQLNRGQPDLQREEILPRSSPLPTEDYSESQLNRGQPDLQREEILPRSSPLPTEDYSESQLNRGQPDLQREEILPRSSPLPTEDYSESQPNRGQPDLQQAEILPRTSPLPSEDSTESQHNTIQNDLQLAELLPISIAMPTKGSSESQLNGIQIDTQVAGLLPFSYSLTPESSSESQSIMETDVQQTEVLEISSFVPIEGSSESLSNDIQDDSQFAEFLPISSSLPSEDSSGSQLNSIQSNIQQSEDLCLSSSIPAGGPVELKDNQPDIVLGYSLPLSTESPAERHIIQADITVLEGSSPPSIVTGVHSSESCPSSNRRDFLSLSTTAATSTENSSESQASDNLVQDVLFVPIDGSTELQLNNVEVAVPPQQLPPSPPIEAQPHHVQTDLLLTESSSMEESSSIATDGSSEPLPYTVKEDIPFIETSLGSSPPSNESIPDTQLFNTNENGTPFFCIPTSEETLLDTLSSEEVLSESPPVTTCPSDNTSGSDAKPNEGQALAIPVKEEVLHNQFPPPCFPPECSPASPISSPPPVSGTVYAEKVILIEDTHPGSPPVNGNMIALESLPTISAGELEVKPLGHVTNNVEVIAVHDVLSSKNTTVDVDPTSDSKLIPSCEKPLHQPLTSDSSEALL
ncbi:uncharacterized protein ACNLHF_006011 [Anomaloglossus baeobatrachus]|uniref:uncharacterized protein LOC142303805 n=1 Tax=Anomaloglossus baeobatrachus TaxID=238106 RepID=UPI003F4FE3C1